MKNKQGNKIATKQMSSGVAKTTNENSRSEQHNYEN